MPKTVPTKPYDWTYTTTYAGHPSSHTEEDTPIYSQRGPESIPWSAADPDNPAHEIPLAELTRQDPILFYAEIPLFEDELHDNGSSNLLVRIVSTSPYKYSNAVIHPCVARDANMYIYPRSLHFTRR